jgi:subtilisin family serine protease
VASPGDTPGPTITVAAGNTTDSAAAADRALPAFFSQMGPDNGQTDLSGGVTDGVGIDVTAPGMNLTAPVPTTDGLRRNRTLSGTSMATPLVAGAVAQELEANPDWRDDPDRVAGYVQNTTRVMPRATVAAAGHGYLAVDKLDATNTTGSQSAARTEAAESRDAVWKAQSDASGGIVSGLLDRLSGLGGLGG